MPLRHLLFRCPECGHDPTTGEKDRVRCPACGAAFARARQGSRIRVTRGDDTTVVAISHLVDRIRSAGGAVSVARAPDGALRHQAAATQRRSVGEEPAYLDGEVTGFFERLDDGVEGTLHLESGALRFEADGQTHLWPFSRVRALQTASSSVQISVEDGSVVQFDFVEDSPYRWEELLRVALRTWYATEGRGEILEFQPRIVVRR